LAPPRGNNHGTGQAVKLAPKFRPAMRSLLFILSMIFSENRYPLFRIML
jgi:hypothetical protein